MRHAFLLSETSQAHTDTDFVRATSDGVGQHAICPDRTERRSGRGEDTEHQRIDTLPGERRRDELAHRQHRVDAR
jgi:hypothetical protein